MDKIRGFRQDETARSPTFYAESPTNSISNEQIEALKVIASNAEGVARFCLHASTESQMHVMVIAQTSGRYWRPKKHQTKIKSFNILEGQMAVVEFTESGDATKLTLLSIEARQLIVMAPSTFHTNAALTPICVHVETIQGPYHNGENDRVAAAFAPEEEDADAGRLFVSGVIERLSRESL